jgi:hypothetical protein
MRAATGMRVLRLGEAREPKSDASCTHFTLKPALGRPRVPVDILRRSVAVDTGADCRSGPLHEHAVLVESPGIEGCLLIERDDAKARRCEASQCSAASA